MEVSMAYVYVSRYLKDELAWAIDKCFWFVSNVLLCKTVTYITKEQRCIMLITIL